VLLTLVENLVVHLVGVHDQVVLAGDLDDLLEHVIGVQRTGRVVRIDDHDCLGVLADLSPHVVEIGHPVLALVAQVMHRRATGKADRRRPQRVVGRRHQYFVTGIEQRIHRHHDQLGNPVADVDILQRHALDPLFLGVVHDRLARRENPLGIGIASGIRQVADDVLLDFLGRIETERGQVADVQLDDLVAFFFHLLGLLQHGAANVVADVGQLGGFLDRLHGLTVGEGGGAAGGWVPTKRHNPT